MTTVITRRPSPDMSRCLLTYMDRDPVDVDLAMRQHDAYVACLKDLGAEVIDLPQLPECPDAVFVEDPCTVFDEVAVITRPATDVRRLERASIEAVLRDLRPIERIESPGALEGGDVLRAGKTVFVGASTRTNESGFSQLRRILEPHGYDVRAVPVTGCLHLKTAGAYIGQNTILVNTDWCDAAAFDDRFTLLKPHPDEPWAGNAVLVNGTVIAQDEHPKTRSMLEDRGFRVVSVPASEINKAEGGLTCCSVVLGDASP